MKKSFKTSWSWPGCFILIVLWLSVLLCLFLRVIVVGLQSVIGAFPRHTFLLVNIQSSEAPLLKYV